MNKFTRNNVNHDQTLTPAIRERLISIRTAIDVLCQDERIVLPVPANPNADWIVPVPAFGARTWTWDEEKWKANGCNQAGQDCCRLEMAYHWDPNLPGIAASVNALWVRVNGKPIYLYVPLGLVGISLTIFCWQQIYINSHLTKYVTPPNFPTFHPQFLPMKKLYSYNIPIPNLNFRALVNTALFELNYLCVI
jgi:hypothetical protein